MHELSIMQSAMTVVLVQAEQARAQRVYMVKLRVGALSGVVPDALQFAFEALTQGTIAEGARLEIESVPARFYCQVCAKEFVAEDLYVLCPECGGANADLRAGRELELASLEVE